MISATGRHRASAALEADDSMLAHLRRGDERCFAELVRSTSPQLLATLRRILRNEEDARDALQETYLAAFRSLASFEGQSRLSTWLHRIAVNAALMKLRSRRRHPEEPIEDLLPRFDANGRHVVEPAGPAALTEEALDGERRRSLLLRCIDQLPEAHRTVLVLRDIEGLGTEEAARALGVSTDAAKMRLHRARQALRTLFVREGVLAPPGPSAGPSTPCGRTARADAQIRPGPSDAGVPVRGSLSGPGVRP